MAFEPGGRADKLGNRLEGRWVAKQFLRLLEEKLLSVTIEAIGDDEKGVDLWVRTMDGTKCCQQCKARNAGKEYWTVGDLKARGVLESIRFQLSRDATCEFTLVSGVPARSLSDICESARNSNGDPEVFYQSQIESVGQERRNIFQYVCSAWGLDWREKKDRMMAFNLLRRVRIELYPDDGETREELLARAGFLLSGEPKATVLLLASYCENEDRLGSTIYADELWKFMRARNVFPKRLAYDVRILPAIQSLQDEFIDSIRPKLINHELIPRAETDICLRALEEDGLVILHGTAGSGKSGILYELCCRLTEQGVPFLPLRLDRRIPRNTATLYGQEVGLFDSPVNCLVAVSGGRPCVLILDQLDAIRWTSSHSANSLDVCKEMMRQVMSFWYENRAVKVIVACRSFDLEHDPEIRDWLSNRDDPKWIKIPVSPLQEKLVREICGEEFSRMTSRQREILANAQNLAMWVELSKEGHLPPFRSATELMRRFWSFRRRKLEETGISAVDINYVLDSLTAKIEAEGKISVPSRVFQQCSQRVVDAIRSLGIIQEQAGRVGFSHQSYVDFLIAERVVEQIDSGKSILDWLGSREKQTLFRREQLRQALAMLAEDSSSRFLAAAKEVIEGADVRFHLKHLALEMLSQNNDVSSSIVEYCIGLLNDDNWRMHALGTVLVNNGSIVKMLIDRGIIAQWLDSNEESLTNDALRILGSVAQTIPDEIAVLLRPYAEKGNEWGLRVLSALCWDPCDDSELMFELRITLARKKVFSQHTNWRRLSQKHPLRMIRLTEAVLSTLCANDDHVPEESSARHHEWREGDLETLLQAADSHPVETWSLFMPHIKRLAAFEKPSYAPRHRKWFREWVSRGVCVERGVLELTIRAAQKLARESPSFLLEQTEALENSPSYVVQTILAEAYSHLTDDFADRGIQWLLRDESRLRLGDGYFETEWAPAERLVRNLSPKCSLGLFEKLERFLVNYHEPDEKRLAEYHLRRSRSGYFGYFWGQAQFFLLPALSADRVSKDTLDLIQVLKRRFSGYSEARFMRYGRVCGGFIGSKLDRNIDRISDNAWLKVVANRAIPIEHGDRWHQIDDDNAVESSVWQFSRSLGRAARKHPERFGRLALKFQKPHSFYILEILQAMALTKPPDGITEEERALWEPASLETVLSVWRHLGDSDDAPEIAMFFCRLVGERASESWPAEEIRKLLSLAISHPDPNPGELHVSCGESVEQATAEALLQNSINCVRGVAAGAIGRLLWEHPELLQDLSPGIERLVSDPHPAVRMAVLEAISPVLRIDRSKAVDWFLSVCGSDSRIPASPHAIHILNHTVSEYGDSMTAILRMMTSSAHPDVVELGAKAITAYHLFYGLFEKELEECICGASAQRKGVAEAAAELIENSRYACKCQRILRKFFNDPDPDVRSICGRAFNERCFVHEGSIELALSFVDSEAFAGNASLLLDSIRERRESLIPLVDLIFAICRALASDAQAMQRKHDYYYADEVLPLLLRLYEQTQEVNPDIASRCLDNLDNLFKTRACGLRYTIDRL